MKSGKIIFIKMYLLVCSMSLYSFVESASLLDSEGLMLRGSKDHRYLISSNHIFSDGGGGSLRDEAKYVIEKENEGKPLYEDVSFYHSAVNSADGLINFIIMLFLITMILILLLCVCLNDPCGLEENMIICFMNDDRLLEVVDEPEGERISLLHDHDHDHDHVQDPDYMSREERTAVGVGVGASAGAGAYRHRTDLYKNSTPFLDQSNLNHED